MKGGESTLLDNYAASSFEEFWAVSIETFFERPFPFREQLPEVYFGLCFLLNQDPLKPDKIEVIGSPDENRRKNFLKTAWEAFKF
ncbi:MAG TPA: zinc-dependent peptidase, partial [Puia sp.]|nr:zinc-dependent peptidase [Puia sp.]